MGKKTSTTTQDNKMPEFQQQFLTGTVIPEAQKILATPFQGYEGQRVAGLTGLQQQALQGYGGLDMGAPAFAQAADVYSTIAGEGLSPERIQTYMSPYTQNVIDASMRDLARQRDITLNEMGAAATRAGAFGGSRQGVAEAETQRAFAETAADTAARLREAGYSQAAGLAQADLAQRMAAAQGGMGAAGAGLQQQVAGLGAQMAAGEAERILGQQGLDALYERYMLEMQYPLTQFGVATGAAGAIPAGYGTQTGTTVTRDPMGAIGGVLGAVGSAGQGLGAMGFMPFSDARLKENIQHLGQVGDFNLYTWDWNEEGVAAGAEVEPTYGVIAQEVEQIRPEYVIMGEDGYRRVDYGAIANELGAK
jgi:hypothetical protein